METVDPSGNRTPQQEDIDVMHARALRENGIPLEELIEEHDGQWRSTIERARSIAVRIKEEGGRALIVGGFARDMALRKNGLSIESKDIDLEVYGIDQERLAAILADFGSVNLVGASFGIYKVGDLDISIPRRDSKNGKGHTGFMVEGDPTMSIAEAARRRDFTINALALDPLTGQIIDEFGGLDDIDARVLRATDPTLFTDDPLRVLRAMQFAGRFNFSVDPETIELCKTMDVTELPKERIGEEWLKLLLKSDKPSVGLEVARALGVLEKLHPELHALIETPQDPVWHPEGTAWVHTAMVVDEAVAIARRDQLSSEDAKVLILSALCHDLGKPSTTARDDRGRITSKGHEEAGVEPSRRFLSGINVPKHVVDMILPLVAEHLFPAVTRDPSDKAVRRLAARLSPSRIDMLVKVAEADHRGRAIPWDGFPGGEELLRAAARLSIAESKPEPLISGRDLLGLGVPQSKLMGRLLKDCYDAQLEGTVTNKEEALQLAQRLVEERLV